MSNDDNNYDCLIVWWTSTVDTDIKYEIITNFLHKSLILIFLVLEHILNNIVV